MLQGHGFLLRHRDPRCAFRCLYTLRHVLQLSPRILPRHTEPWNEWSSCFHLCHCSDPFYRQITGPAPVSLALRRFGISFANSGCTLMLICWMAIGIAQFCATVDAWIWYNRFKTSGPEILGRDCFIWRAVATVMLITEALGLCIYVLLSEAHRKYSNTRILSSTGGAISTQSPVLIQMYGLTVQVSVNGPRIPPYLYGQTGTRSRHMLALAVKESCVVHYLSPRYSSIHNISSKFYYAGHSKNENYPLPGPSTRRQWPLQFAFCALFPPFPTKHYPGPT
jgi:hypothetical protein